MAMETNNGKKGGTLKGKPHSKGGIKAVVTDSNQMVELEGGEVIINKEASKKHWKELSRINQSAGGGVPILPPNESDADPDEYGKGGTITFNPNHIPSKWLYDYAKKIKDKYPKVWDVGGNIFGNEAFKNLERVLKRGYWTDSEEWMYKKWQSFNARHSGDIRIAGIIANLKWLNKVDKGWAYMKDLIEQEIAKKYPEKKAKGGVVTYKQKFNKKYGYGKDDSHTLSEVAKETGKSKKGLQQIYNKGIGAYKTNPESVRPNVKSKEQWAMARVYSAVMGGKASRVDKNELAMENGGIVNGIYLDSRGNELKVGDKVKYEKWYYTFQYALEGEILEFNESDKTENTYNSELNIWEFLPIIQAKIKVVDKWNAYGKRVKFNKTTFIPIRSLIKIEDKMAKGGKVVESLIKQGKVDLKFYDTTPKHAKEYGLKSRNPLYVQNILVSKNERLKGIGKKVLAYIDEYAIKNGNDVVFGHITQKADFTKDDREALFSNINMIKNWLKSNGYIINDDNNDFHKVITLAKGGITLLPEGTLIAKDKKSKLDYKKIGNNYEFSVYDGEPNPVENHLRVQFKKRNGNKVTMTNDQFISYIYAEGFIDDRAKGGELAKGIKEEGEHRNTAEKLYNRQITPSQAPKSIAKEHIKEDPKYYSKLEKLNAIEYAKGGTTSFFDYKKAISLLRGGVKIGNMSWLGGQYVIRDKDGFLVDNNGNKDNFDKLFNSGEPNRFYVIDDGSSHTRKTHLKKDDDSPTHTIKHILKKHDDDDDDDSSLKVQFFTLNDPDDPNAIPDSVEQNLFAVYPTKSQDEPVQVSFKQRFKSNNGTYYLTIDVYYTLNEVVNYITNGLWKPYGEEQEPKEEKPKEKKSQQKQPKPSAPKPPKKKEQKPKKKKFDTSEALRKYLKTSNVDNVSVDSPSSIAKEIAVQFSITMEGHNQKVADAVKKELDKLTN